MTLQAPPAAAEGLGAACLAVAEGLGAACLAVAEGLGAACLAVAEGLGAACLAVAEGLGAACLAVAEGLGAAGPGGSALAACPDRPAAAARSSFPLGSRQPEEAALPGPDEAAARLRGRPQPVGGPRPFPPRQAACLP